MPAPKRQSLPQALRRRLRRTCSASLCALLGLLGTGAPKHLKADGLFGLVGVPSVDIEGYGWLGDLYLEHTLKVLSTSEENPEPQINAVFIEDALWIISGQLQQQGYLYPSISVRINDEEGTAIYEGNWAGQELMPPIPHTTIGAHVQFSITPGVHFYFESINIKGLPADLTANPASFFYPTDQLLSFKSTRFYNRSRGISGVQGIVSRLRAMGYRDADAEDQRVEMDRSTGAVHFFATIKHGPVYYADEVIVEPGSLEIAAKVLQGVPLLLHLPDQPRLTPEWLQNQIQQVRNRYYEHGYPEVRIMVRYEDASAPHSTEAQLSTAIDPVEPPLPAEPEHIALIDSEPAAERTAQPVATPETAADSAAANAVADNSTSQEAQPTDAAIAATDGQTPQTAQSSTADSTQQASTPQTVPQGSQQAISQGSQPTPSTQAATTPSGQPASALEAATAPVLVDAGAGLDPAAATAALLSADIAEAQPVRSGSLLPVQPEGNAQTGNQAALRQTATNGKGSPANGHAATVTGSTTASANTSAAASGSQSGSAPADEARAQSTVPAGTGIPRPSDIAAGQTLEAATLTARTQSADTDEARHRRVIIQVQSGPKVKIGSINFAGEYGTSMAVLNSQLTIEPGEELNRNSVETTRNKLNALGIFRTVEIDYTEVDENTWDITYNVQMKQRTEVSLIMGVGTFDIIRGGFLIEQNNLWGLAHNQRLRAVQSFKATDVTYRYGIPQVFGNDVDFYAKGSYLFRQEISFNRQEYGAAAGFQHFYRPLRTTFDIQYSLEQLSARNRSFTVPPGPTEATVSSISLKASHNGLDNPIFPTRGWQARAGVEFALRDLGGQVDYQRIEMAIAYHVPLTDSGLILHTGLRHGVITTTGTAAEEIPVNRRFFMGGENTVRGYRRDQAAPRDAQGNQIGAVSYVLWQVELEQRLTENLSVVTFLDALGNAADISQYPFNETVASIGLGLNYRTFVGPLRLEYGYNVKKRPGDPNGTIQVSIGFPF